ncbi:MAG: nucleoside recognition protein [Bacteroidales bacterium]|nr:nucleoside recognition protein [Bacteroidales bacterium]
MCKSKTGKASHKERIVKCVKEVLPGASKTCVWIIKITVSVSFAILFLKYFNLLPYFSDFISPVFNYIGLPGEAALAFVSGYFVNVYAAISAAVAVDLDVRALTILGVMTLCAHNMITETAVQKKTGSSAVRIVIVRTFMAFALAYGMNKVLPGEIVANAVSEMETQQSFMVMFKEWVVSTLGLVAKMTILIFSLSIMQKLLAEYGVIKFMAKGLRPLLAIFGLPAKTAFLWIVANILGLAYGAAVMIDESRSGKISKRDIDLLNSHIGISHSNFEDLFLVSSIGGVWYIILLTRWIGSFILVWEQRLEYYIIDKIRSKQNA